MRITLFLLVLLGLVFTIQGQTTRINRHTYLYSGPFEKSKVLGEFAYAAQVQIISQSNTFHFVETETGMRGYIMSNHLALKNSGTGVSDYDRGEFDSKNRYVLVAGLRARAEPRADSKVVKQLKMNEWCSIYFLPYDSEAWVSVGNYYSEELDKSFPYFIQRKYVGPITNLTQYINLYKVDDNATFQSKKMRMERMLEMAYWANDSLRYVALSMFRDFVVEHDLKIPLSDIEFELFAIETKGSNKNTTLNYYSNDWEEEDFERFYDKYRWNYFLNGDTLRHKTLQDVESLNLAFTKSSEMPKDLDECGWGFETVYYLDGATIIDEGLDAYSDGLRHFSLFQIDFTNPAISIKLAGFELNGETDEREFIKELHPYIRWDLREGRHFYSLNIWEENISIVFKDGKPILWHVSFQC